MKERSLKYDFGLFNLKTSTSPKWIIKNEWGEFCLKYFYGEEHKKEISGNLINFGRSDKELKFKTFKQAKEFLLKNNSHLNKPQLEEIRKEVLK